MAYVLFPGEVVSETDGDIHYITAPELARLYGVDYKKCKVVYHDRVGSIRQYRLQPGEVALHPRSSGDYSLPCITGAEQEKLAEVVYVASLEAMRKDGLDILYCRHVDEIEGAPNCCSSCHEDEETGHDSLYDEFEATGIKCHLCCAKYRFLLGR